VRFNLCLSETASSDTRSQLNILVDIACSPRLADFGLVRLADSATAGGFTHTTNGFDFRWTSPQRLNEEVRGLSDDVYSFGCVGYYVRQPPPPPASVTNMMPVVRGSRPLRRHYRKRDADARNAGRAPLAAIASGRMRARAYRQRVGFDFSVLGTRLPCAP
jgi:serine/threonine protein kinase